jgi:DNA-binding transcriptional LysR family regulator
MKAAAPGIELSLIEMHPDVALSQLREGAIDVAVVFRYDDTVPDDMQFQHLFGDPMLRTTCRSQVRRGGRGPLATGVFRRRVLSRTRVQPSAG